MVGAVWTPTIVLLNAWAIVVTAREKTFDLGQLRFRSWDWVLMNEGKAKRDP
jgi:hypothetical protein